MVATTLAPSPRPVPTSWGHEFVQFVEHFASLLRIECKMNVVIPLSASSHLHFESRFVFSVKKATKTLKPPAILFCNFEEVRRWLTLLYTRIMEREGREGTGAFTHVDLPAPPPGLPAQATGASRHGVTPSIPVEPQHIGPSAMFTHAHRRMDAPRPPPSVCHRRRGKHLPRRVSSGRRPGTRPGDHWLGTRNHVRKQYGFRWIVGRNTRSCTSAAVASQTRWGLCSPPDALPPPKAGRRTSRLVPLATASPPIPPSPLSSRPPIPTRSNGHRDSSAPIFLESSPPSLLLIRTDHLVLSWFVNFRKTVPYCQQRQWGHNRPPDRSPPPNFRMWVGLGKMLTTPEVTWGRWVVGPTGDVDAPGRLTSAEPPEDDPDTRVRRSRWHMGASSASFFFK